MRALALTLAASAALVAACGGSSGEPQTAPPVSTSPASASSPSPAAAEVPEAAKAATSTGAEAFARFFYGQVERAFATKDPGLISAISEPGCSSCDNFVRSITKLRDNNERVDDLAFNVVLAVAPAVSGDTARVDITWSSSTVAIRYDAAGKEIYRDGPYKRVDDEMKLVRRGDAWRVLEFKSLRRVT
ncbi:MAG: hypothetical protein QOE05_3782 [Actinomycetota bacterium]|jgi:hypothetical protein|nr:hypothetical protein [Actinomycetota bacterium]